MPSEQKAIPFPQRRNFEISALHARLEATHARVLYLSDLVATLDGRLNRGSCAESVRPVSETDVSKLHLVPRRSPLQESSR